MRASLAPFAALVALSMGAALATLASAARGDAPAPGQHAEEAPDVPGAIVVDRVAVRFLSPETGGASKPRFITERMLHFEARLEALGEQLPEGNADISDWHVRAALEHHVAEEMLAAIPLVPAAPPAQLAALREELRLALIEGIGSSGRASDGAPRLAEAMAADGISDAEVDALVLRQAKAALYLDRQSPLLDPSDEQLREVFRTSAHPYRSSKSFDAVRAPLERWFVAERLGVAEAAFLQQARTRVKIFAIQG